VADSTFSLNPDVPGQVGGRVPPIARPIYEPPGGDAITGGPELAVGYSASRVRRTTGIVRSVFRS
jgi:hypothetical protein